MEREKAQELAELDVSNIIAAQGKYLSLFLSAYIHFCMLVQFPGRKQSLLNIFK